MLLMASGTVIHLIVLPYADLTLLAANSALAIIANLLLSIWLFDEKIIWKYDLPGVILIIAGTLCIVLLANKKQEKYEGQAMMDLISHEKTIIFFIVVGLLVILTHFIIYAFKKALRTFETDADLHDHKTLQENADAGSKDLIFTEEKAVDGP